MAKRSITVCDDCDSAVGVSTFVVEGGGRLARIDLCEDHAEPLVSILDRYRAIAAPRGGSASGRSLRRGAAYHEIVTTMDELDRLVESGG